MAPVLYSFRRCPYAMRARLALWASGECVELREVALGEKPADLLAASPKGTVPVLVLPDGVLEQSLDIMLWALRRNDPRGWLPSDPAALDSALQCIATHDGAFKHHLDRYKYPHRYGLVSGADDRAHGAVFLQQLDARLRHTPSLAPGQWGLLDAALAPFVRQFARTDAAWFAAQDWPALARWLQGFEVSAGLGATMDKVPPWKPGDTPRRTCFGTTAECSQGCNKA